MLICQGHTRSVNSVAFDGTESAVSGSSDLSVKNWDLKQGACRQSLEGHCDYVWSVTLMSRYKSTTLGPKGSDGSSDAHCGRRGSGDTGSGNSGTSSIGCVGGFKGLAR